MWKHRRALVQRGAAGRLGRRGLSYLLLFQVLLPLTAPMVDIYGIYGLIFLPPAQVATIWIGFTALQVATAGYALRLDRERYGPLWSLPLQQIVYRQLMYLVVIQATVMALRGGRLRWHSMIRIGAASAHAGQTTPHVPLNVPRLSSGYFDPARPWSSQSHRPTPQPRPLVPPASSRTLIGNLDAPPVPAWPGTAGRSNKR